jgi:hypothetical protein
VFDGIGTGCGEASWVIRGTREDGTAFDIHRSAVNADAEDLTFAAVLVFASPPGTGSSTGWST